MSAVALDPLITPVVLVGWRVVGCLATGVVAGVRLRDAARSLVAAGPDAVPGRGAVAVPAQRGPAVRPAGAAPAGAAQ